MKTYKIYAVPSHQTKERTSGVDYARVIQPMKYLNGYENGDVRFEVTLYDIHNDKKDSWLEIAKEYDAVFLNYTVLDWQYAAMGACVRGEGKKIILDVDDAIWFVQKDNITYEQFKKLNADYILSCIISDVDGVTTTNPYLRNVIVDKSRKYHDKVKIMPNQVDFTRYSKTFPPKDRQQITLMHFGATGHFDDLLDKDFVEGINKIFSDYPNVKLKTIGSYVPELKYKWGIRYENDFGDVDIYKWIENRFPIFMDEADIMVVPLRDTKYNRCKSDIKFCESASAMKPGVFSRTRPYVDTIEDGKTGYLAQTAQEWYSAIKELIESREKRIEIGTNAYNYVKENRQIQQNIKPYADFIQQIIEGT